MNVGSKTILAIALVGLVVASAVGFAALERPRIRGIDNEWGTVTPERTEVVTHVAVENSLLLRVGGAVADIEYVVTMNDVEAANGRVESVDLAGDGVVTHSTWFENEKIPAWWVTHVRNDETTTVRVQPDVVVDIVGIRFPADSMTRTRTVRTNFLDPLRTRTERRFEVLNETALIVEGTDARWGNVTDARTPINATATVRNPTDVRIPITDVQYTVRMNDVIVGNGTIGSPGAIEPNGTREIAARAVIDNSKLDEWWVSHRQRNGTTWMTVDFTATVETAEGERRLTLDFLSFSRTFRTDIFGSNDPGANGSLTGTNEFRDRSIGDLRTGSRDGR
jgi:LEA14-like dessication related protein